MATPAVAGSAGPGAGHDRRDKDTSPGENPTLATVQDAVSWQQIGQASYYSSHYIGRRTASGASYNPQELTAAHPFLPLGTRLLVVRRDTGRSVVVTVTDRQAANGRVIDLSRRAASLLDMLGSGTAPVRLVAVSADEPLPDPSTALGRHPAERRRGHARPSVHAHLHQRLTTPAARFAASEPRQVRVSFAPVRS